MNISLKLLVLIVFHNFLSISLYADKCKPIGVYEVTLEYSQKQWKNKLSSYFLIMETGVDQTVKLYHLGFDTSNSLSFDKTSFKNKFSKREFHEIVYISECEHTLTDAGLIKPNKIHGKSYEYSNGNDIKEYYSVCPVDLYFYGEKIYEGANILGNSDLPVMPLSFTDNLKVDNWNVKRKVAKVEWSDKFTSSYISLDSLIKSKSQNVNNIPESRESVRSEQRFYYEKRSQDPFAKSFDSLGNTYLNYLNKGRNIPNRIGYFPNYIDCYVMENLLDDEEIPGDIGYLVDLLTTNDTKSVDILNNVKHVFDSLIISLNKNYKSRLEKKNRLKVLTDRKKLVEMSEGRFESMVDIDFLRSLPEYDEMVIRNFPNVNPIHLKLIDDLFPYEIGLDDIYRLDYRDLSKLSELRERANILRNDTMNQNRYSNDFLEVYGNIRRYLKVRTSIIDSLYNRVIVTREYYINNYPINPILLTYDSLILAEYLPLKTILESFYSTIINERKVNKYNINLLESNIPPVDTNDVYWVLKEWNQSRGLSKFWNNKSDKLKLHIINQFINQNNFNELTTGLSGSYWRSVSYDITTSEWILKTLMETNQIDYDGNCEQCCVRLGFKYEGNRIFITSFYIFSDCY